MGPGPVMGDRGIMNCGASPRDSNTQKQYKAHKNQSSLSSNGVQAEGPRAMGHLGPGFSTTGL
jgi:hypothetical protein